MKGETGICQVCGRRLGVTGYYRPRMRPHGPKDDRCKGSGNQPVRGSWELPKL